jgi:hypothetical protein
MRVFLKSKQQDFLSLQRNGFNGFSEEQIVRIERIQYESFYAGVNAMLGAEESDVKELRDASKFDYLRIQE